MHTVKTPTEISLYFHQGHSPKLERVEFAEGGDQPKRTTIRGRTRSSDRDQSVQPGFEWTNAVKALAMLLVRHAASAGEDREATIQGNCGTPATSLDEALDQENKWMNKMFGNKRALIGLITRRNRGSKDPGAPVSVSIRSGSSPTRQAE